MVAFLDWCEGFSDDVRAAAVDSLGDLDRLLDHLTARAVELGAPFKVTLRLAESAPGSDATMSIVIGAGRAFVEWLREEPWSCITCMSERPADDTDLVEFAADGHYSELPRHMWIDVPLAREAMRHYFQTGQLTSLVQWEPF